MYFATFIDFFVKRKFNEGYFWKERGYYIANINLIGSWS